MKLTSITWGSDVPLLAEACAKLGIALSAWTPRDLEDEEKRERCTQMLGDADVVLLRPTNDAVWDEIIERLDQGTPIISFGYDPSFWPWTELGRRALTMEPRNHSKRKKRD